jgi:hypothetical protein
MNDTQIQLAVEHYLKNRPQLGARAAAQHTCLRFGVDPLTLSKAVRDAGGLLKQQAAA